QRAAAQPPAGADPRPLRALGFISLGGKFMNNPHDILDDRIDVVTRGLLGLTVSCARCHDHKFDPIPTADYYSLYGVFASSIEPEVPPMFDQTERTPEYVCFEDEMKEREQKLEEFRRGKFEALIASSKSRMAEYLMKAHAMRGQPATEDFMLIADGNDLNPSMVTRWRVYLERTGKRHDPVFAPWHAFAALPDKEFAVKAKELAASLTKADAAPINARIRKI